MNRSNSPRPHSRNMKTESKKRKQQTKQDIPKVTVSDIQDENYHLSQRRDDTDMSNVPALSTSTYDDTRKINFLKAVNSVKYLERKKIEELETGKSYLIEQVERITTKYGDAITAILRGPVQDTPQSTKYEVQRCTPQFKVFLPKRFLTRLSDEHMELMNEGGIYLKFIGGKYNDLEFH